MEDQPADQPTAVVQPIPAHEPITLPPLNFGVGYSVKDSAPIYFGTFDVAQIFNLVNLEVGYGGRNEETLDEAVGILSFSLVERGWIKFPILKYLSCRVGAYVGAGHLNFKDLAGSKIDYGPAVSAIVSVKF